MMGGPMGGPGAMGGMGGFPFATNMPMMGGGFPGMGGPMPGAGGFNTNIPPSSGPGIGGLGGLNMPPNMMANAGPGPSIESF